MTHDFPGPVYKGENQRRNGGSLEGEQPRGEVVEVVRWRDDVGGDVLRRAWPAQYGRSYNAERRIVYLCERIRPTQ